MSDANEPLDNITEPETSVESATEPVAPKARSIRELLDARDDKENDETKDSDEPVEPGSDETAGESDDESETEEEVDEVEEEEEVEPVEDEDEALNASFGNLKKEFPDIFKKFPSLRNKLGREYAFSDIYPTLDEARVASQKSQVYDIFDKEINLGNPVPIIQALPTLDVAKKFAEQILPALRQAHPDLYTKAVDPFTRLLLNKMHSDAENSGDKNLALAARYVSKYLYGKAEIPALLESKRNNEPDPEKEELKARLARTEQNQIASFETTVTSSVVRVLNKEAKSLLDPKDTLAPKMQTILLKQIIEELDEELKQNPTHMARMRAFRERAQKSGLSDSAKSQILSAYLQNARPLLKTISQRIKSEAFGKKNGIDKSVDTAKRTEGRKVIPSSSVTNKQPIISSKVDWKNVKQAKAKGLQMEDLLG